MLTKQAGAFRYVRTKERHKVVIKGHRFVSFIARAMYDVRYALDMYDVRYALDISSVFTVHLSIFHSSLAVLAPIQRNDSKCGEDPPKYLLICK
jgi:hypothetical protein